MKFLLTVFFLLSSARASEIPDWSWEPTIVGETEVRRTQSIWDQLPTLMPKPTLNDFLGAFEIGGVPVTQPSAVIPGVPTVFPKPDVAGLIPSVPTLFPKPDIAGLIPSVPSLVSEPNAAALPSIPAVAGLIPSIPTVFPKPDVAGWAAAIPTVLPKPDVANLIPSVGIPTVFPKPQIFGDVFNSGKTLLRNNPIKSLFKPQP